MREAPGHPHGQQGVIFLSCDYCGARDSLPADAAQRVWAVRQRIDALWWSKEVVRGQDAMICQRVEGTWLSGTAKAALGPITLILVLVMGPALYLGRASIALIGVGLLLQLSSVIAGMVGGFMIARARYRSEVRPHILARAPSVVGRPARCHCCGAELPYAPTAFSTCNHCHSSNVVSDAMAHDRAALLDVEAAAYRARAAGNVPKLSEHLRFMGRAIAIGNVLGLVAFFGGGALLAYLHVGDC